MALPFIMITGFILALAVLGLHGLAGVVDTTVALMEFCQTVFVKCVESIRILKISAVWLGITFLAGGFLLALVKGALDWLRAESAVKRLPVRGRAGSLVLIDDVHSMAAFTHGLLRPRVYLSRGLFLNLERAELKAVFLHELCHRRRRDPLRFFLLAFIRNLFFPVPLASQIISHVMIRKEEEADEMAASVMKEPLSLSGALLKAALNNNAPQAATRFSGRKGGAGSRVRSLLDGKKTPFKTPGIPSLAISLMASLVIMASLTLPFSSGIRLTEECTLTHCELHKERLGKECRTHCKTPSHIH